MSFSELWIPLSVCLQLLRGKLRGVDRMYIEYPKDSKEKRFDFKFPKKFFYFNNIYPNIFEFIKYLLSNYLEYIYISTINNFFFKWNLTWPFWLVLLANYYLFCVILHQKINILKYCFSLKIVKSYFQMNTCTLLINQMIIC